MPTLAGLFSPRNRQRVARELENARQTGDVPFSWDWEERRDLYGRWQSLYDNSVYETQVDGGYREVILKDLFGIQCSTLETTTDLIGPYFNPVKGIVDAYQNVLLGAFGREIKVAPEYNGVPVTPILVEARDNPLGRVWTWSNMDTAKQTLQAYAAGMGCCGIRVVAFDDPDPLRKRVRLQFDHPARIKDYQVDGSGNVIAVLLEYTVMAGQMGEDGYEVTVKETFTKESFEVSYNGKAQPSRPNPFGFCPYVILKHTSRGEFGIPAFFGSETPIHLINRLRAYVARGVPDIVDTTWFATASGKKPEGTFKVGNRTVAYVQTQPDSPPPSLDALVAPLNLADAQAYCENLEERVRMRQPEMAIGDLKLLSTISGETIAKVLKPAESEILKARAAYEHAIIRALQMAMSEMAVMGLLPTFGSSAEQADAAYQGGEMNFEFESRPALPMTPFDAINNAKADTSRRAADFADAKAVQALGVDTETTLKVAGFNEDERKQIKVRKSTDDSVPTDPL